LDAGIVEDDRLADVTLDPTIFPNAATLQDPASLGRLSVLINNPLSSDATDTNRIVSFGARSFSVYRVDRKGFSATGLRRVFDSGSQLESISAEQLPDLFNSQGEPGDFDSRSDNKGPEPEGLTIGEAPPAFGEKHGRPCLFLTTERLSAVFVYDLSNPEAPVFQSLALPPLATATGGITSFSAPEGITYAK
jgi:hypothetical protein